MCFSQAERKRERCERNALQGWLVGDAMRRQFQMVPVGISLDEAGQAVLFTSQDDFPVIEENRLVGMLSKPHALQLLSQGHGHLRVGEVMRRDIPTLEQNAPLSETVNRMQVGNFTSLPVAHGGRLVGILSLAGLRDWMTHWTVPPNVARSSQS